MRAAGRKPEDVLVRCPYTVTVTDDPERALRPHAAPTPRSTSRAWATSITSTSCAWATREAADAVREAWAQGGSSAGAAALPDELVDQLGMAGGVEACCDALDEAAAAGFPLLSVAVTEREPSKRAAILGKLVG